MASSIVHSPEKAEELMYGAAETGNLERAAELFQNFLASQNSSFNHLSHTTFPRAPTNYAKLISVTICNILGAFCILLNAFVVSALLRNRRRVLTNVFYVLVLHCAFVDLIRGTCLVAWGMPHLLINSMRTMEDRLLILKMNQFTLIILRSCNLLTIFNLLVFTTNEFIVIKYPLHYRRFFHRRTVLVILAISWVISLLFGVGSVFSNFFESAHSVMVLNNGTIYFRGNATTELKEGVTRRQIAGISINVISMLMIFVLCYLCLVCVLICYGTILRTIRQFHGDTKGRFHSEESQKFNRSARYVEIDREGKSSIVNPPPSDASGRWADSQGQQPRCNSHRKWRSHLMSRHKYLIVIGSVLFVDVLFLFPYSGIQLVAFLHLNNLLVSTPKSTLIRWGLQILIGIHSVCQPLCYFRMNEFRRLACCGGQKKISRSKSFSQLANSIGRSDGQSRENGIPVEDDSSHHHHRYPPSKKEPEGPSTDPTEKRYPNPVRRLSRLMSRSLLSSDSETSDCEYRNATAPKILVPDPIESAEDPDLPHTPTESELEHILDCGLGSPFLETNWNRVVGASLRFRTYGDQKDEIRPKLSTLSDMRSSTCFERESICLPDDPEQ